ncbi:MAG TPA: hypothetical protein PLI45_02840 [Candidatus Woesebacteria bacterium]|nr:hypothetical protein [Candidatus Woesebacteria bacterium]
MTLSQIISLISISALTVIAVIVGIELIIVLKELKNSLLKLNRTLDTADDTLQKISEPAAGVLAVIEGFRQSGRIIETISGLFGHDKKTPPVNLEENESR